MKYKVAADRIVLGFGEDGSMVKCALGEKDTDLPISGQTRLDGFQSEGKTSVQPLKDGGYAFTRRMMDSEGRPCAVVTDTFVPEKESIRWEVEISGSGPDWTAPIVSRIACAQPEGKLIWTAWGSPDFSGSQLSPERAALVLAGKASESGVWSDPLVPVGFLNRDWHYGNVAQGCPVGGDYTALPLVTLLDPATDAGLSVVLSPDDVLLHMDLKVSAQGNIEWVRLNHRIGAGKPLKFTLHLVPHEASWRGGLRFLTKRYPEYFESPNPRAHKIAACGAYSIGELPIDADKFRKMAFGFNWKLSDDFPYMGMFIPPVKDVDEKWERSRDEPSAEYKGPESSCRQMNDYARSMKAHGFSVLSYFNVTEFGKMMYGRQPEKAADAPDLWKDPAAYIKYKLPTAVVDPSIKTSYKAYIVDPGDPEYLKFMLEQADRNTRMLPESDGICIDRSEWLRIYNRHADDGVSLIEGRPARSLFRSWAELMSKLGPQLHRADKVIFSNMLTMRLELCREVDGIYTEYGNNGNALNGSAFLGLRKPVVYWTYNETLNEPEPDAFMQRHLYMGCFPTVPYPWNNHCINPEPKADRLYLDYGPLLQAMRGKKWVLEPRCVEVAGGTAKASLFSVPGGYVLPVTFGGTNQIAKVAVRNVKGLKTAKCEILHPGDEKPTTLTPSFKEGVLELSVPLQRGCALVKVLTE